MAVTVTIVSVQNLGNDVAQVNATITGTTPSGQVVNALPVSANVWVSAIQQLGTAAAKLAFVKSALAAAHSELTGAAPVDLAISG